MNGEQLLNVEDLHVHFAAPAPLLGRTRDPVRAVDGVSLSVARGESLGLVGESGSGKTTLGRAVLALVKPTAGRIVYQGVDLASAGGREMKQARRSIQMVFQDPYSSLNPRWRAGELVRAPLDIHGIGTPRERDAKVAMLMERVGLRADQAAHFPHEFSGGQRQRICIARALALDPQLLVCDEAVSALDVSVQAQILNLLARLQRELGLSLLFISHDLGVVRHLCHRVAVMQAGRIVETAAREQLFAQPAHPYTRALLASIPVAHPRLRREVPAQAAA